MKSAARCAEGQTAVAFGRTQRSEVVICAVEGGDYEYIGVRSSDNATLQAAAESTDDGFVARTDGATYTVSPTQLVVVSGGKVIYRDTWIDYQQPQFSAENDGDDQHSDVDHNDDDTTTRVPTGAIADYGAGGGTGGRRQFRRAARGPVPVPVLVRPVHLGAGAGAACGPAGMPAGGAEVASIGRCVSNSSASPPLTSCVW